MSQDMLEKAFVESINSSAKALVEKFICADDFSKLREAYNDGMINAVEFVLGAQIVIRGFTQEEAIAWLDDNQHLFA
ncbi:MAG: hypothetical protein ABFD50_04660 [Smithella sp.]